MAKYHVNMDTGKSGRCRAEIKPCPLGEDTPHFETEAGAQSFLEKVFSEELDPLVSVSKYADAPNPLHVAGGDPDWSLNKKLMIIVDKEFAGFAGLERIVTQDDGAGYFTTGLFPGEDYETAAQFGYLPASEVDESGNNVYVQTSDGKYAFMTKSTGEISKDIDWMKSKLDEIAAEKTNGLPSPLPAPNPSASFEEREEIDAKHNALMGKIRDSIGDIDGVQTFSSMDDGEGLYHLAEMKSGDEDSYIMFGYVPDYYLSENNKDNLYIQTTDGQFIENAQSTGDVEKDIQWFKDTIAATMKKFD